MLTIVRMSVLCRLLKLMKSFKGSSKPNKVSYVILITNNRGHGNQR